ncbi:MAG: GNAT family N-acetyltransferase [Candidatus Kryptonium sp.]|nr:GNAT family N-acetyltransferase [Candidatus Kryptonium sp.]MCX7762567.1 GNAT family N-acetyltransferase [Candidatus Kryptonium sp.]MDW8109596.1 GNAT family N-acetyltransferase [Candidatus Kryptonium sp.]
MAQLYIETSQNFDDWDKFNLSSAQSNPFQSYDWLKTYSEFFNFSVNILFVKKGEETIAGLIYPLRRKLYFRVSTPLLFSYYSGILFGTFQKEKRQKIISEKNEAILKIHEYLRRELDFFNFKLHYTIDDIRQFKWLGYKILPRHTFVLSLESTEKIWDGFSNSLKRKIKDAQERGLNVVRTKWADKLAEHQILSFERTGGRFFIGLDELKRLIQNLVEKNLLTVYHLVDKNNQVIASRGVSIWNGKAYDVIAGMGEREINSATHFLVWKILEDLSSQGVREFDFCGADIQSVAFFKMQFGGDIRISFDVSFAKGLVKFFI